MDSVEWARKAGFAACPGRHVQVTVLYKRPTDLALREDVPVVCNLLLADIMDEGDTWQNVSERCRFVPEARSDCTLRIRTLTISVGAQAIWHARDLDTTE
jgi:hypothetical protein